MKDEQFEVATFDSDSATEQVFEGGLSWEDAKKKATELWESGEYYGVEIIDSDPDNMEPIVWIESRYSIENPAPSHLIAK